LGGRDRPEDHPRVVLVGPPNAGKSRLFNALLGQPRALVLPRAGTTRDYLAAPCDCDGLTVELIDTAGVEPAGDALARQAQALRADQAARADLLLDCRSADAGRAPALAPDRPRLDIWTKCDLAPPEPDPHTLATSARTGAGIAALRTAIAAALRDRAADGAAPAGTGARCHEGLVRASQSLGSAVDTVRLGGGDELVAVDLRQAVDELGKVVGAVVTDDILDRIFRRFCIGK
jgi:tRNA modification GTPase